MDKKLTLNLILAGIIIFIAVFAPYLTPFDPNAQNINIALSPPNSGHILGADVYGRDLFSRVIMGARNTVLFSLLIVVSISLIGGAIGAFSAFKGKKIDSLLMRVSDVFLAFPQMVFAIAMSAALSGGLFNAALSLIIIAWPKYARIARSLTLSIKNMPYIEAARLSGTNTFNMLLHHIFPNIAGTIIVTAVLDIGTIIMELAALSFLGLGAKPPTAEWGAMMNTGRNYLQLAPHIIFAPGIAIFLTVVTFNLLGDKLRDALDTKK